MYDLMYDLMYGLMYDLMYGLTYTVMYDLMCKSKQFIPHHLKLCRIILNHIKSHYIISTCITPHFYSLMSPNTLVFTFADSKQSSRDILLRATSIFHKT